MKLEIHVDGVTYSVPRRQFKSGKWGYLLAGGALIHGRKCWLQVLVRETPELSVEEDMARRDRNRFNRKVGKYAMKARKEAIGGKRR